jgi:hypothetical protein
MQAGFIICRRDEEWTLDGSVRGTKLLYIAKDYTRCVTFTLGSRSDDTLVTFRGLDDEGDRRPLLSK